MLFPTGLVQTAPKGRFSVFDLASQRTFKGVLPKGGLQVFFDRLLGAPLAMSVHGFCAALGHGTAHRC
eukprot:3517455-Rhodomonas_salina.1